MNLFLYCSGEVAVQLPRRVDRAGVNAEDALHRLNTGKRPERGDPYRSRAHVCLQHRQPMKAVPCAQVRRRIVIDHEQIRSMAKRITDDPVVSPAEGDETVTKPGPEDPEAAKAGVAGKNDKGRRITWGLSSLCQK